MYSCFSGCCSERQDSQEGVESQRHPRRQRRQGNQRQGHHAQQGHSGRYEHEGVYGNEVSQAYQEQQQYQGQQRAQHNGEYELYQLPRLCVKTMQEFGYEISEPIHSQHPTSLKEMMLYEVSYPAAQTGDSVIATFGTWEELTQLVIERIFRTNDGRPDNEKPHANDIILSFWGSHLGRDIISLRSLFFKEVEEESLQDAKPRVYAAMGTTDGRRLLSIRAGRSAIEDAQFVYLSRNIKFGRLAWRIVEWNEVMRRAGLQVVEFMFIPFSRDDTEFHFKIFFG